MAQQRIANRYTILSLLGQGGMADVYEARDEILGRTVAIKVLRAKMADDPLVLVRFTREASAASKLSHPNVVDIYDVGESNGLHYIVMEYVKGVTLKQMISRRGPLDVYEALSIMKQLVSGVAAAHHNGIIHRDIKPQNIMIKADGTVKITDFGIAVAAGSVALTHNNAVMGSAHYLAPESARGQTPDLRVDIYSLGIVFYELLTNQVPFAGDTPAAIAFKHMQCPMPLARQLQPSLSWSVENIIIKATAKDPNERYVSADAMLYDLNHCMDPDIFKKAQKLELKTTTLVPSVEEEKTGKKFPWPKGKSSARSGSKKTSEISRSGVILTVLVSVLLGAALIIGSLYTGFIRIPGLFGFERVPDVTNLPLFEAVSMLQENHFTNVTEDYRVSDMVPEGSVISISSPAGEVIQTRNPLVLTVSKGPSFLVPDYVGQTLEEVQAKLASQDVQIQVDVEYKGAANTNPGIILQQEGLQPGDRIDPSQPETIKFTVSQYPSITLDGTLIGMNIDQAKNYLNEQGIAVVCKNYYGTSKVQEMDPPVGTTYTQSGTDSVVVLYH